MSSPTAFVRRACADGSCRLRGIRARKLSAGVLGLAFSFSFTLVPAAAVGQFPIRQMPTGRYAAPASSPSAGRGTTPVSGPIVGGGNALGAAGSSRREEPTFQPHPAIARITVPEKNAVSYGSGTLIDARGEFGLVVTNWHVVRDAAGTITVDFPEGHRSAAHVVRTDPDWDLAALAIHRPKAEPLPISDQLPRVGEVLTIAGYGSGQYRAAAGPLAGFAAPRFGFPEEMLDLAAVEARQGDSGGPIINQRGEVCGVLFGSAPGYTIGSYGGRVRQFLATVIPDGQPGSDRAGAAAGMTGLAANGPAANPTTPPANALPGSLPVAPSAANDPAWLARTGTANSPGAPPPQATALHEAPRYATGLINREQADPLTPSRGSAESALMEAPVREWAGERDAVDPKAAVDRLASNMPLADAAAESEPPIGSRMHASLPPRLGTGASDAEGVSVNEAPSEQLLAAVWKRFGGTTLFDQAKAVLAIIGVLAVAVQFWRMSARREEYSDEE